jgi:hypothetical protein
VLFESDMRREDEGGEDEGSDEPSDVAFHGRSLVATHGRSSLLTAARRSSVVCPHIGSPARLGRGLRGSLRCGAHSMRLVPGREIKKEMWREVSSPDGARSRLLSRNAHSSWGTPGKVDITPPRTPEGQWVRGAREVTDRLHRYGGPAPQCFLRQRPVRDSWEGLDHPFKANTRQGIAGLPHAPSLKKSPYEQQVIEQGLLGLIEPGPPEHGAIARADQIGFIGHRGGPIDRQCMPIAILIAEDHPGDDRIQRSKRSRGRCGNILPGSCEVASNAGL